MKTAPNTAAAGSSASTPVASSGRTLDAVGDTLEGRRLFRALFRRALEHILREGTSLAGEGVEVTTMFIDVRDFTAFAERSTAPEFVAQVNRLFERCVPIIHAHSGHVDKFVGDGLLAVFGAPRREEDHAGQALEAALEIESAVGEEFAGRLAVGIGLYSGTVVAGNVAGRLEFSVIGDAVNVAARVEAATRTTGDTVLVSQHMRRLLTLHDVALEDRPEVPLKGKTEAVALYAPVDVESGVADRDGSTSADGDPRAGPLQAPPPPLEVEQLPPRTGAPPWVEYPHDESVVCHRMSPWGTEWTRGRRRLRLHHWGARISSRRMKTTMRCEAL